MKQPKELTTLAPLSKYLAMPLLLVLLILSFYFGLKYQQTVLPSTVPPTFSFPMATTIPPSNSVLLPSAAIPQDQYYVTPTIISSSRYGWSTYVDKNNLYSFSFPHPWRIEVQEYGYDPPKAWVWLYFFENAQQYAFEVGQGGRGVAGTDNIEETQVTYGGKSFDRKTFYHAGKPFLISVAPTDRDTELTYFNHISIDLPPTNTSDYIQIFNQILSSLAFTK